MTDLNKKILMVMSDVFGVSYDQLDMESSQDNVEGWDSVNHLHLVTAIEDEFGISIPIEEVGKMTNVKIICAIVKELC